MVARRAVGWPAAALLYVACMHRLKWAWAQQCIVCSHVHAMVLGPINATV